MTDKPEGIKKLGYDLPNTLVKRIDHLETHGIFEVSYLGEKVYGLGVCNDWGGGVVLFYACTNEEEPSHQVSLDGLTFDPIPDACDDDWVFTKFLKDKGVLLEEKANGHV